MPKVEQCQTQGYYSGRSPESRSTTVYAGRSYVFDDHQVPGTYNIMGEEPQRLIKTCDVTPKCKFPCSIL